MRAGSAALVLLTASLAAATTLDVPLARYADSQRAGALGVVEGRVYAEGRTPREPEIPLTGTGVTLLPRSGALLARLEELRQHARDSSDAYRQAATAMRRAREAYEAALWDAGAPDLVRATLVDAEGRFRFDAVPAGPWMLVAIHRTYVDVRGGRPSQRDQTLFRLSPRVVGYYRVTLWLREVSVDGGGTERIALTDRGGWFNGVVEETVPSAAR